MGLIERLYSIECKITKTEKKLIEYFKANIQIIPDYTIEQISKFSGISMSSITRFIKKIGYNNFRDFRVEVAKEISLKIKNIPPKFEIGSEETVLETAKRLVSYNIRSLDHTVDILSCKEVELAAKLIGEANKIYFVGLGYSGIVALDTNYKFMRIGINCVAFDSSHTMITMAPLLNKDDLLFVISDSGETFDILQTVKIVKENKIPVVALTKNHRSQLVKIADVAVQYYSEESDVQTGSVTTKFSQFFMIDLIYAQVLKNSHYDLVEKNLKTIKAIRQLDKSKNRF